MTTEERFWAKVERVGDCLLWTAGLYDNGYGMFWNGKRTVRAHRFAYELKHGPIPEGLDCLHNCPGGDNRKCVNVDHLFLGTKKDNYDDAVAKGRIDPQQFLAVASIGWRMSMSTGGGGTVLLGERNPAARMTEEQAREILRRQPRSRAEQQAIASEFGISIYSVKKVLYRQTWTHLSF